MLGPELSSYLSPPQSSIGSNTASPIISSPRFIIFAIFASVPASTITFVMTLCACKLYSGIIMRRPPPELVDAEEETVEKEVTEEYADTSERFELVRDSDVS